MNNEKSNRILNLLGESLKNHRKLKGLSLREMAALCNIDHSDIAKIEKGQKNITILTLYELAEALEISSKEILPLINSV